MFEISFKANQTFGLTGFEVCQSEQKVARQNTSSQQFTDFISKRKILDNLSDRFSNQSDHSLCGQLLSDGLALFRTVAIDIHSHYLHENYQLNVLIQPF